MRLRYLPLLLLFVATIDAQTAKRPLTHADYAGWRSIQSPAVSPDGNYVAYALAPQDGDGEFVLIDLKTNAEVRHPRGSRGTVNVAGGGAAKGKAGALGPSQHAFTPDGKYVLFNVYPTKAEREKKKTLGANAALAVLEIATNKLTRVENARSYQVAEQGTPYVAFLRGAKTLPADPSKGETPPAETPPKGKGGGKRGPTGMPVTGPPAAISGELVLRNLADGTERTFDDVGEYSLSRDGKALVYVIAGAKKDATPGVWAVTPGKTLPPVAIRSGPGRYGRLTWDEKQTQLAFFHTPPPSGETKHPPAIVHWKRAARPAVFIAAGPVAIDAAIPTGVELKAEKPAVKPGWQVSEAGGLTWSLDGQRLYFGMVPPPAPAAKASADKAAVELWHFQDDFIQPMQKVRFAQTQAKTYRAVFDLAERTCRQLADDALAEVVPAPSGDLALGIDDRRYRRLVGGAESIPFGDTFVLNAKTGEKKPLMEKQTGIVWSPGGNYLLRWDGKNWHSHSVADGKAVNLTEKLKVSFAEENFDQPSTAPPHGVGGWTAGDESVLLYDRYDVWRVRPDGSGATNVTQGVGRKGGLSLRVVTLDPKQRTIDPSKNFLLRAEDESSRDTGFYSLSFKDGPKLLILGARAYNVLAFKNGRYLLTISTFNDYPDLYTADEDFREIRRLTDANPRKKEFVWGKAEIVKYKSDDGVTLHGVLLKPENFDPKKKYPMIVYIYERLSQNMHRFVSPNAGTSINPTYYASNGYLVLMPDIAYTIGSPGPSAQKCILPAIDKVIAMGCVDEKAIGIQGHSWGGYQTAYLITQTNRFAAAAAGAPVSNMTSAYGGIRWGSGLSRQFQYERTQSRIGAPLWEQPEKYISNSPVFMADKVKTPLMILHNDKDEAVPWQEGIQYYLALRRLDKEVYLFNYVGEGHGLSQRKNQIDYTIRMQQFFDHHLRGAAKPDWMVKGEAYSPRPGEGRPPVTSEGE